jgi:hypothetical protein
MSGSRAFALVALLFIPSLFAQTAPQAETRIALVIGNGSYANVPLKNPVNDAQDLARALTGLGFSVSLLTDADLPAMSRAVRDFGNAIKRPDAVALFYYSGHGLQYRGANYLIPAKSDIQDPDELSFSAVNADLVYAKMESSGDKTNIVILDACRNNPFPGAERASERGLAVVGAAPPQSLIVYSTAPGKTAQDGQGRNGVFTAALLAHLGDPNLDAELMVRRVRDDVIAATGGAQVPWQNSSITGSGFRFSTREPEPAPTAAAPVVVTARPVAAGQGLLTITSDPPGMQLLIDGGGDLVWTPVSLELPAGAHSFEPQKCVIDKIYYSGQPIQWINVATGEETRVPVRIKPEMAKLECRLVPAGYRIIVDGEDRGEAPLRTLDVKAGVFNILFEKEGEPPRTIPVGVKPGSTATVSWGTTKEIAIQLSRAEIKLDGRADSWEGIEPLWAPTAYRPFMGDDKCGITAVYMCRDDKYLYWRIDFKETDPLLKPPKAVRTGMDLLLQVYNNSTRDIFSFTSDYNFQSNGIRNYIGDWNEASMTWQELADGGISVKHNRNISVGRVDWAWVRTHIFDSFDTKCILVSFDSNYKWMESSKIEADLGWIDFTK